ncbi:RNA polymerase sigma-70 factor, ECF subfamily [Nonomuraea solani]|uniref:RNA polymerase sigma-70 factor, ECF subfamily n=1 Tax=Nonomuraea solani TaxID=1144553 RepID=A0A1H6ETE7_9ACTN|nr:RNA polymerase sigma factor SigJ [Nonomuraea solani]SEH01138.1 RNA polymerase sigma-70 factor, ECF subfamily [Nonomuraea solani]
MMPREAELSAGYAAARSHLTRVAYAILGTVSEAEDVVSECWFKLVRADRRARVQDVESWATVVVARAAMDVLKTARLRRETYTGPWLPEPLLTPVADPADRVTLDESVGFALLVVLESLTPAERTAWVLHDLFGLTFEDVAATVGRTPAAVRQLAARARRHVGEGAPRVDVDRDQHRQVVERFLAAAAGGRLSALVAILDPGAVLTSDGDGRANTARQPVHGAERVARFVLSIMSDAAPGQVLAPVTVNGALGLALYDHGKVDTVVSFTVTGGLLSRIDFIRAPAKLR